MAGFVQHGIVTLLGFGRRYVTDGLQESRPFLWPSVRDRDRDGISGLLVGYPHRGTKGRRFVRRGHVVVVERVTLPCASARNETRGNEHVDLLGITQ